MIFKSIFLLIFILSVFKAGYAEFKPITLKEALVTAESQNPAIKEAWAKVLASSGAIWEAKRYPNPVLGFESESIRGIGNVPEGKLGIFLEQEFELFGKRSTRISAALTAKEVTLLNYKDTRRQIHKAVKQKYLILLSAYLKFEETEKTLKLQEDLHSILKKRFSSGDIAGLEVMLAKTELAKTRLTKENQLKSIKLAQFAFNKILGAPLGEEYLISEKLEELIESILKNSILDKVEKLNELAINRRPDLLALKQEVLHKEEQLKNIKAEGTPNVTVGVGLIEDRTLIKGDDFQPDGVVSEARDKDRLFNLSLRFPLPFFDNKKGAVLEASYEQEALTYQVKAKETEIKEEISIAHERVRSAGSNIRLYENEFLPNLEQALKISEKAYKLGGQNILFFLSAQKSYIEGRSQYLELLEEKALALIDLEASAGGELP